MHRGIVRRVNRLSMGLAEKTTQGYNESNIYAFMALTAPPARELLHFR